MSAAQQNMALQNMAMLEGSNAGAAAEFAPGAWGKDKDFDLSKINGQLDMGEIGGKFDPNYGGGDGSSSGGDASGSSSGGGGGNNGLVGDILSEASKLHAAGVSHGIQGIGTMGKAAFNEMGNHNYAGTFLGEKVTGNGIA